MQNNSANRPQPVEAAPLGSIVRISEVARRASRSRDSIERLARLPGSPLVAVRVPGRKRILGFTEQSVRNFLGGVSASTKEVR